jgi:hypothetical protein
MTNLEAAIFRGEFFGLKILVLNCLSEIAAAKTDPATFLSQVEEQAVAGIAQATSADVRLHHLQQFRNAAAGIVAQAIEVVRETHSRSASPPRLQ